MKVRRREQKCSLLAVAVELAPPLRLRTVNVVSTNFK